MNFNLNLSEEIIRTLGDALLMPPTDSQGMRNNFIALNEINSQVQTQGIANEQAAKEAQEKQIQGRVDLALKQAEQSIEKNQDS